jgi:hypothetical protein
MDAHPKTIQIFLPDGEPRGIRIAEITTRVVQAILVPRNKLQSAAKRSELASVGVYFLLGESEERAKPCAYFGEAEDCLNRLGQHHRGKGGKDFWNTAIVAVSKTDAFTKAHVKYLEWHGLGKAKEIGRYVIENSSMPSEPHVPEPMLADLMDSFETINILNSTLGYPIFEPVRRTEARLTELGTATDADDDDDLFSCTRKDVIAQGRLLDDGFVVYEGSTASLTESAGCGPSVGSFRDRLLSSGIFAGEGERLVFQIGLSIQHAVRRLTGSLGTKLERLDGVEASGWSDSG